MSKKRVLLEALIWNFFCQAEAQLWGYMNIMGWGSSWPICNTGLSQSPIDLRANVIGMDNGQPKLQFFNYNLQPSQVTLRNNGHTVVMTSKWGFQSPPAITGPHVLNNEFYVFFNAHLHWNNDDNSGSEHSINGQKYAAEIHLVHHKWKYGSFEAAQNYSDGLVVVGILYQVNDTAITHLGMQALALMAQNVPSPGMQVTYAWFDFSYFLPSRLGEAFYSYTGSLTTPACSENVRWIVFERPELISSAFLRLLRRVTSNDGSTTNTRPLQMQNTRLVEYYP